jgi:hypothetical protein
MEHPPFGESIVKIFYFLGTPQANPSFVSGKWRNIPTTFWGLRGRYSF